MTEFRSPRHPGSLPHIPDNLTVPQFILDFKYPQRPQRPQHSPWFIEDHSGRPIHFREVRRRTRGLANAFSLRWNIKEDDAVCLFSPNDIDYPVTIWATHTLGAIVTLANPSYTAEELLHQLTVTKAKLLVVHSAVLPTAIQAAAQAGLPEDRIVVITAIGAKSDRTTIDQLAALGASQPEVFTERKLSPGEAKTKRAFLSFSSGTTGKPKAVEISHYSIVANVIQMSVHNDVFSGNSSTFAPGGVLGAMLPFFHIYGLVVQVHFSLFAGLTLAVMPKFSFAEYLKSIARHRITHLLVVPPQVVLLTKQEAIVSKFNLDHVKYIMSGAAPLSGELVHKLSIIFPNAAIGQGYGLTETCTTVCMIPPEQKIGTLGSAGMILPGIRARVVKADGQLGGEGEQGELVVSGPSMAIGYLSNVEATKETFVDGWVHTGDEVIIKKGEIYVVDRLKEILKVKGFQVAPAELEGHLLSHPAVEDVCVVGIPHEYKGEAPLAFVVVNPKLAEVVKSNHEEAAKLKEEIKKHVADHKVEYKRLEEVEFIDAIPKNPSGKILRRILRDAARKARSPVKAKL